MNRAIWACLGLLAGGCVPRIEYAKTTSITAPAREATCQFDIITTRPDRPFDELGVIDLPARSNPTSLPSSVTEFRAVAQPHVCAAGGDGVITEVNGFGQYIRGTVIHYRTAAQPAPTPAPSAQSTTL
ncbi:hypothetical protein JGU66_10865 [Myxococcaceae bacterium JPH2]|nr:hypothetical protein [Myxococcaceae bacterium JPH2]